jgi:phospholipid transport system substrate-binding protein
MKAVLTALALACASLAPLVIAPAQAATAAATLPAPSRMVLDNSSRVIATLEKRRAEFNRNPAALRSFISSEFSQMFDKDYAARQVLGRHARGATDADVANFADALTNNLMQRYGSSLLAFNTKLTARVKSQSDLPRGLGVKVSSEFSQMFDKDYAARQVLGRHARGASDADVAAFADALSNNLMQRYGSSLLAFNTKLTARVKSQGDLPRGLGVKVSSELVRSGGEPVPVDYLMRQSGGSWKVFDVMVEGVSFVQTFRAQFDAELQHKTIAQVTQQLRAGTLQADAGR